MQRNFFMVLILAQLLAVLIGAQPVQAAEAGFVGGSVFVDGNGNQQAEPQETRWIGATVYFRSQTNPAQLFTTQTDAEGHFMLTAPYDVYDVWASVNGQAGPQVVTAEIAEVGGQGMLDVPVNLLFLPFMTSAQ